MGTLAATSAGIGLKNIFPWRIATFDHRRTGYHSRLYVVFKKIPDKLIIFAHASEQVKKLEE